MEKEILTLKIQRHLEAGLRIPEFQATHYMFTPTTLN